ncbi:hypothetical protein DNTS_016400 [Danionella cerebrum]|uniref:Uncharacterized protein n=1 Tax=Danionella cerebrum TaxID=2873325 RepID=A0A553Q637_9TELE|nr:hypothetical protein DNTS_016400 [Danionella translucida]
MRRMSASQRHQWKAHHNAARESGAGAERRPADLQRTELKSKSERFQRSFFHWLGVRTGKCLRGELQHTAIEEGKRKRGKQRIRWKRGGSLKREGVRGRTGEKEAERERVDAVDEWDTIAVQTKPEKVQRIKETYSHPSPHCTTTVGPFCGEVKEKMAGEDGKATKSS